MHWGMKWRKMLKDYPETWESGNSLWIKEQTENVLNRKVKGGDMTFKEAIIKASQDNYNKAYMEGYNKGRKDEKEKK